MRFVEHIEKKSMTYIYHGGFFREIQVFFCICLWWCVVSQWEIQIMVDSMWFTQDVLDGQLDL